MAVSLERPRHGEDLIESLDLRFPILVDENGAVARTFGLTFQVPESLRKGYRDFGIDLAEYNGDDTWTLPVPATYLIDRDGKVVLAFVDPDYTQRLEPQTLVDTLKALERE